VSFRAYFSRLPAAVPAFLLGFSVLSGGLRLPWEWLVFGALLLCWFALRRRAVNAAGLEAPLLFFAWAGVAALFSPDPLASVPYFGRYAVFGLLFFSAASAEAGEEAWLKAVYVVGGAAAAIFVLQRVYGLYTAGLIGGNPNYSAVFCAAAFAPAVLRFSDPAGGRRFLYSAFCLLLACGLAASGSRGAAAAAFLAAAAGLAAFRRWRWLAALCALALAAAVLLPSTSMAALLKLHDPRAFARPHLWASALRAAAASPLLGWGPGSFGGVFELFKFPFFDGVSYYGHSTLHAHGEFFNLAAEGGFPAAALLALAAWQALRAGGLKRLPLKLCALAALLEGGADMIFYSGSVALLFWGSLGYGAGGRAAAQGSRLRYAALAACCLAALALAPLRRAFDGQAAYAAGAYAQAAAGHDPALAMALLRSAELDNPSDPFIAEAEGRGRAAGGDPRGAEEAFKRALALEPGFAGARLGLARVYAASGRNAEACAALPAPYAGPEPRGRYQAAIAALDPKELEIAKKELCEKRRTGAATAPGRKTR
jgi:O-antigen ligase